MRKWMIAGLLATSSITAPAAAAYQDDVAEAATEVADDKVAKEIEQMTKLFANVFDTKDAAPIEPARLALAETTMTKIMPDGIYARLMKDLTDKIFGALFSAGNGMSDLEIVMTTGVEIDAEKFDDAKRKAVTDILDPSHAERSKAMQNVMGPMFDKMSAAVEGPMREGLARAYARKFSADQLTELNAFLATPTGNFYASESFALQADPEVMQAMFQALPQMMGDLTNPGKEMEEKMAAIPPARSLADLSDKELASVAKLLGTTAKELKDYKESNAVLETTIDATTDAATAAGDAAAAAGDAADPFAGDTGMEPWWDRDNWDAADRERMKALDADAAAKSEASSAAYEAAFEVDTEIMLRVRERYLKQGWKPEVSDE